MKPVLVLNAGSSSVKFALIDTEEPSRETDLARGIVEGIGQTPRWSAKRLDGQAEIGLPTESFDTSDHRSAVSLILAWININFGLSNLAAAGHRVVHGGAHYTAPVRLTAETIADLRTLVPLAPLHQPHNLAAIVSLSDLAPDLTQVACFDTAFHATIPDVARHFALPREITALGVRRYGFHGLSYSFIADELQRSHSDVATGRVLVAHLGNGASLCAMKEGKSIATTMGFSALDGLMMGTRSGTIDPAVIFYLMRERQMDANAVEAMLYNRSGLLGVSGLSNDMRTLRKAAETQAEAREAVDLFTYRIIREAGSLIAALDGLDALVFTAGIGENDAALRSDVIDGLRFTGLSVDQDANQNRNTLISKSHQPKALVLPTNEEIMIARETAKMIKE
jgi:acetate kinase